MLSRSASAGVSLALLFAAPAIAQPATAQPATAQPVRTVAATSTSPAGSIANRPPAATVFSVVPDEGDLYTTDTLVCLPGSSFVSRNGALVGKTLADFDRRSPLPVLETAFTLHRPASGVDLDLTLSRGLIELTNRRGDGAATVQVRFWEQKWTIVLENPGSRAVLGLWGRWPAGSRFRPLEAKEDPARAPGPAAAVVFLVVAGSVSLDVGGTTLGMKAPPGPAELRWDSVGGIRPRPQRLDKLPEWVDPAAELSPEGKKLAAAVEKFRAARATAPALALDNFLSSTDPAESRVALVALGAFDDLERLVRSVASVKTTEERDFAITVLRHWLGRGPGQDQRLYDNLTGRLGFTDVQARTLIELLYGISTEDAAVPETYEVLIDYLGHEKPVVRSVAAWHLVRLVPQGREIVFKPNASEEEVRKAQAAWKKLVPTGQLPPGVRKE